MISWLQGGGMRFFLEENSRWFLWIPVFLGAGIAFYFSLPWEPSLPVAGMACAVSVMVVFLFRHHDVLLAVSMALFFFALGFLIVVWRADAMTAPVWNESNRSVSLTGRVVGIEMRPSGGRMTLENIIIGNVSRPVELPEKIRLNAHDLEGVIPGHRVSLRAIIMPPAGPAAPYAYDFARQAWFMGLGGVGYVLGNVTILPEGDGIEVSWKRRLHMWYADLRFSLTKKILDGSASSAAPVAAALMTGGTGGIPAHLLDAYRDSGLAHLLSISGLHMSLVAGFVFVTIRRGLVLVPAVALRYPIKKWAAGISLPLTLSYLLIAGAPIPTVRAFIMVAFVLLAVLIDRTAISQRLVALAAIAVLLLWPESLLSASFQMSFAAVVALVAFYENGTGMFLERRQHWFGRFFYYGAGIALTTLIAGGITSVYGLYHFNRIAMYGVVANMAAIPVTGFWIMPWAVIAFLLMPFGWEHWALACMGWGIEIVNSVATTVAAWPGAVVTMTPPSAEALGIFTLGGAWLCLWRRAWRWWGIPVMIGSLLTMIWVLPPSFLVTQNGKTMAARTDRGNLMIFPSIHPLSLQKRNWLAYNGGLDPLPWPKTGVGVDENRLRCDSQGCLYREENRTLAVIRDPAILHEECRMTDIVVSTESVSRRERQRCGAHIIDRFSLLNEGAHAVWVGKGVILSTRAWQGERPWSTGRKRKSQ